MYIDATTFWVVAVGLGIAIWVVYYGLSRNSKGLRFPDEVVLTKKGYKEITENIDRINEELAKIAEDHNAQLRQDAEFYNILADFSKDIESLKAQKKHAGK